MGATKSKDKRKVWLDKQEKSGKTTLPIYAYLDKELYDTLRQYAFDEQASKGEIVREALREYLAKHKKSARKKPDSTNNNNQ